MTPGEAREWLTIFSVSAGLLGGAVALAQRWGKLRSMRKLECRAVRYQLDAVRHVLWVMSGHESDPEETSRQLALVSEVRDEIYVADGHKLERASEPDLVEIKKWMRRTQALEARKVREAVARADEEARSAGQAPMFKNENQR